MDFVKISKLIVNIKSKYSKSDQSMNRILFLFPLLVFCTSIAYAEPFDNIETSVLDYDDITATLQITWDQDENSQQYEVGCVSCIPNSVKTTSENSIIMSGIAPLPNSTSALLYLIAYDSNEEIISAKQVLVELQN